MNIVVIDDSELFRSGVISYLTKMPNIEEVNGGGYSEDNIWSMVNNNTDFLIIDFEHQRNIQFGILKKLKSRFSNIKIIVITGDRNRKVKYMSNKLESDYLLFKDSDYISFMNILSNIGYN